MRIFPVLDVMNGVVVRGVSGQRESYRPVQSVLISSCDPIEVATVFRNRFGLSEMYVADLDAIQFGEVQTELLVPLAQQFPGLWVDCGIRNHKTLPIELIAEGVVFVVGLETLEGPEQLAELCRTLGSERIVFSLDLKAGQPLGQLSAWHLNEPLAIAEQAIQAGVETLIVLDLAQVGISAGLSTLSLCCDIKNKSPQVQVVTGGGVRHLDDLFELETMGIDGALVASAFHNGNLTVQDIKRFTNSRG